MFIIDLHYLAPLEQVDQHLKAHIEFLDHHYASGHFLASGRKNPRNGGIILAQGENLETIQHIITKDPFHIHGLAEYRITEFSPIKAIPELAFLQ